MKKLLIFIFLLSTSVTFAQTIGSSFNVSSVTYNSTGDYTVNFTTAMANTTYGVVQASKPNTADSLSLNNYNILSNSAVNVFYVIPTVGSRNVLSASVAVFSS